MAAHSESAFGGFGAQIDTVFEIKKLDFKC